MCFWTVSGKTKSLPSNVKKKTGQRYYSCVQRTPVLQPSPAAGEAPSAHGISARSTTNPLPATGNRTQPELSGLAARNPPALGVAGDK